jgi:hypothetical protein
MTVLNLTWFRAHPPPAKGEGIICCYYKRFSYPLCQVRVKLSPRGEGEGGGDVILFIAFALRNLFPKISRFLYNI